MSLITDNKDLIVIALGVIGFILALGTFGCNLQQRKIENTFKIMEFMRNHIGEEQIGSFVAAFHANNPLSGITEYEFVYPDGKKEHLDHFFSEGGSGNGDIHNIIEIFNLVAIIMRKCYQWTHYLEAEGPGHKYFAEVLALKAQ